MVTRTKNLFLDVALWALACKLLSFVSLNTGDRFNFFGGFGASGPVTANPIGAIASEPKAS